MPAVGLVIPSRTRRAVSIFRADSVSEARANANSANNLSKWRQSTGHEAFGTWSVSAHARLGAELKKRQPDIAALAETFPQFLV